MWNGLLKYAQLVTQVSVEVIKSRHSEPVAGNFDIKRIDLHPIAAQGGMDIDVTRIKRDMVR